MKISISPGEPIELDFAGISLTITAGSPTPAYTGKRRGRKPGQVPTEAEAVAPLKRRKKRTMSAEGRARIAEAARRRWATIKAGKRK